MAASWFRKPFLRRRGAAEKAAGRADDRPAQLVDEKLWYLQRINIFADMTASDMRRLAERTTMHRYARGKVIARPDDPPETIYLIKEGRVKLCRYSAGGREHILALLERGDIFGERALLDAQAAMHCEAFEDTLICVLRRQDFEDLMQTKPELALRVMKVLAERLRQAEEVIENLAFHDAPGRLSALLVRLAEAYGEPHADGRRLMLRFTHQDLASMIGATRETVTNVLIRFRDEGLIAVEEHHIVVRDLHRLATREP
ncbi:MAG: Crp/Fnr family transcriptional regulator [Armatimonadota bacterium]